MQSVKAPWPTASSGCVQNARQFRRFLKNYAQIDGRKMALGVKKLTEKINYYFFYWRQHHIILAPILSHKCQSAMPRGWLPIQALFLRNTGLKIALLILEHNMPICQGPVADCQFRLRSERASIQTISQNKIIIVNTSNWWREKCQSVEPVGRLPVQSGFNTTVGSSGLKSMGSSILETKKINN